MSKLQKKDIVQMFGIIRAIYKSAFNFTSEEETEACIGIWHDILNDYSKELVFTALKNCIRASEFEPKPATLVKECDRLLATDDKSDIEYWHELTQAISRAYLPIARLECSEYRFSSIDRLNEIFTGLSKFVQIFCGDIWGFIELARMDKDTLGYEKGRFLKQLPDIRSKLTDRGRAEKFMELANIEQLKLGGEK